MPLRVETFNRARLQFFLAQLVALDALMIQRLGTTYSNIAWGEENFSRDIRGKWDLSQIALVGEKLVGFWIASASVLHICHSHRVAVDPNHSRSGIGKELFQGLLSVAKRPELDISHLTLELGLGNTPARKFYESLGFRLLTDSQIAAYLVVRHRSGRVLKDHLEEADGSCFVVMGRKL